MIFPERSHLGRRQILQGGLGLLLPAALSTPAAAADWPSKPLKLMVGYPAGSSPDALARIVAEPLGRALGQPVVVENRAGAAGTIGVSAVVSATDGHTIGLTGNGPLTTAKLFNPQLRYDVARDLQPISLVASSPFALVGKSSLPPDLPGLIAYAKEQGDRLTYGSVGVGSGSHLSMELLKKLTGIRPIHVPFPGFPQVLMAIVAGQVDLSFMIPSVAASQVQTGRIRVYGLSTASRSLSYPDVPPIAQVLKLPQFDVAGWNAIFGPSSMPAAHAARLSEEINRIVRSDEVRHRLFEQGWQAMGTAPQALVRQIREDTVLWSDVVRLTGARSE